MSKEKLKSEKVEQDTTNALTEVFENLVAKSLSLLETLGVDTDCLNPTTKNMAAHRLMRGFIWNAHNEVKGLVERTFCSGKHFGAWQRK